MHDLQVDKIFALLLECVCARLDVLLQINNASLKLRNGAEALADFLHHHRLGYFPSHD